MNRSDVSPHSVASLTTIVADMLHVESMVSMAAAELPAEYKLRAMDRVLKGKNCVVLRYGDYIPPNDILSLGLSLF
jgi:hypothetical protein